MADIRKTIEIAYQADVTNLLSNLKKIPGMTDEEAKKMVKALSQQLKQTERAAKKAAKTNSQSMKKMQGSAKKTAQEFRKMKRGASEMGRGLGELGTIFGDSDTEMGKMVGSLSMMSITASALIPLFSAMRAGIMALGASTAMATGGLSLLAGSVALLVSNMGSGNSESELQNKKIERLSKTYKKLSDKIEGTTKKNAAFRKQMVATLTAIDNLQTELEDESIELSFELGEISKAEFEQRKFTNEVAKSTEKIKKRFDDRSKSLQKSMLDEGQATKALTFLVIQLDKEIEEAGKKKRSHFDYTSDLEQLNDMRNSYHLIGKEGDNLRETESKITKILGKRPPEYKNLLAQIILQQNLEKEAQKNYNNFADTRKEKEEGLQNLALENIEATKKITKLEEQKVAASKAKAKADKNEAELQSHLAKIAQQKNQLDNIELGIMKRKSSEIEKINIEIDQQIEKLNTLQAENDKIAQTESERLNTTAAIEALEQRRLDRIAEVNKKIEEQISLNLQAADKAIIEGVIQGYENQKISLQDLYSLEDQLRNDKAEKEGALHRQVMSMISAEEQARLTMGKTLLGDVSKFTQARLTMIQNTEDAEQAAITKAFYLNQAASAAGVAFATAENITKAVGMSITNPVLGAALVATAVASGAAQMGAIMSQPPPQKKHMGGMATDERNYTLLRGEAVLSRQATRRLGEEGVRNLNTGGTPSNQVVVVSPFKHYDRFISTRNRRTITTRTGQGGF